MYYTYFFLKIIKIKMDEQFDSVRGEVFRWLQGFIYSDVAVCLIRCEVN